MATEQLTKESDNLDLKQLLRTLTAVKQGDFSARMPIDQTGMAGKIADTLNSIIDLKIPKAIANIIYQNSSKSNDFRFWILNKSFSIQYRYPDK